VNVAAPSSVRDHVVQELERQVSEGRRLAAEIGEDGRPPLTPAQRWRFTSSALLRRTLFEGHPQLEAFERHCYYGLLDRKRFSTAVALFKAAADTVVLHALPFRLGMIRWLLQSSVAAPDAGLQAAGLWHALSLFASTCGMCGPSEHPSLAGLCARVVQAGFLDDAGAAALQSEESKKRRSAMQPLIEALQ